MTPHEVLARMAATLRSEIGPAVEEPFARTQAFMAAVVLAKLAGQLAAAEADARADDRERDALVADLAPRLLGADRAGAGAAARRAARRRRRPGLEPARAGPLRRS